MRTGLLNSLVHEADGSGFLHFFTGLCKTWLTEHPQRKTMKRQRRFKLPEKNEKNLLRSISVKDKQYREKQIH